MKPTSSILMLVGGIEKGIWVTWGRRFKLDLDCVQYDEVSHIKI
jgi:hypothetical protein